MCWVCPNNFSKSPSLKSLSHAAGVATDEWASEQPPAGFGGGVDPAIGAGGPVGAVSGAADWDAAPAPAGAGGSRLWPVCGLHMHGGQLAPLAQVWGMLHCAVLWIWEGLSCTLRCSWTSAAASQRSSGTRQAGLAGPCSCLVQEPGPHYSTASIRCRQPVAY